MAKGHIIKIRSEDASYSEENGAKLYMKDSKAFIKLKTISYTASPEILQRGRGT